MKRFALATTALLALAAPAFAGSHSSGDVSEGGMEMTMPATVVDVAVGSPAHSTLVELVVNAGLTDVLSGEGPFTVFAPTNDAFMALPPETLAGLANDPAALQAVLTYHVVPGKIMAADLMDDAVVTTVNGSDITVDLDTGVKINNANVIAADLEAGNGVVHVIDTVLVP